MIASIIYTNAQGSMVRIARVDGFVFDAPWPVVGEFAAEVAAWGGSVAPFVPDLVAEKKQRLALLDANFERFLAQKPEGAVRYRKAFLAKVAFKAQQKEGTAQEMLDAYDDWIDLIYDESDDIADAINDAETLEAIEAIDVSYQRFVTAFEASDPGLTPSNIN